MLQQLRPLYGGEMDRNIRGQCHGRVVG